MRVRLDKSMNCVKYPKYTYSIDYRNSDRVILNNFSSYIVPTFFRSLFILLSIIRFRSVNFAFCLAWILLSVSNAVAEVNIDPKNLSKVSTTNVLVDENLSPVDELSLNKTLFSKYSSSRLGQANLSWSDVEPNSFIKRKKKRKKKKSAEEENPGPPEDFNWMELNVGVANNISRFTRLAFSGTYRTDGEPYGIELGQISRLPVDNPVYEDKLHSIEYVGLLKGYMGGGKWSMWNIEGGIALIYKDNETCLDTGVCKLKGGVDFGIPVAANLNWGRYLGLGLGLGMMIYDDGVVATLNVNLLMGDFN